MIFRGLQTKWIYDLSQIDFDLLKDKYEKGRKKIQIDNLKDSVEQKIEAMIKKNRTRMNFRDRYAEVLQKYNDGSISLDDVFKKLVELSKELNEEEHRYVREELDSEQELTVYDLLSKPDMKLTKAEIKQVKSVARKLFQTLVNEKMVLDWTKKQQTRAGVKLTIKNMLDDLPQAYSKDIYEQKCDSVYNFVYEMDLKQ